MSILTLPVASFDLDLLTAQIQMHIAQNNARPECVYLDPDIFNRFLVLTRGTNIRTSDGDVYFNYNGIQIMIRPQTVTADGAVQTSKTVVNK